MKQKLLFILLLAPFFAAAQPDLVTAKKIRATQVFQLAAREVNEISTDTAFLSVSDLRLATQRAVKKYTDSRLGGRPLSGVGPTTGQTLKWTGTQWEPGDDLSGVTTDATLGGNGSIGTPLKIAQQGATTGQVLKWDGATWLPNDDLSGGGGGADVLLAVAPLSGSSGSYKVGVDTVGVDTVYISNNGIWVRYAPSSPIVTESRLTGNGTAASPLDIAPRVTGTGVLVEWDARRTYGTEAAPVSGNVTYSIANANVDEQFMIHKSATAPTFPASAFVSGVYQLQYNNVIRLRYISSTVVQIHINE